MDGILQDLGVEFVDESESERLVMGSKIEASLRYSLGIDVLTMPEIPNVPQLSPKYMQKIIDEVKSEIEKCDIGSKSRLLATLKLQFLSSLVFRQVNANTADSTNTRQYTPTLRCGLWPVVRGAVIDRTGSWPGLARRRGLCVCRAPDFQT